MQRPSIPPRILGVLEVSCFPPHGAQQSTANVGSSEESNPVPNGVITETVVDKSYWSRPGASALVPGVAWRKGRRRLPLVGAPSI